MTALLSATQYRPSGLRQTMADWPLWLVLCFAFAVRLFCLDQMELWWDEFVTLGRSLPDIPKLLSGLIYQSPSPVSTDCSPPLHHLLVHAALQLSHQNSIIKLPSVLFGCLTIACVMGLSKKIAGRRCATMAGLFCAIALFHVYYSRDIRWYSVYYGCSLTAIYLLYRAIHEDKAVLWIFYGLSTSASLYASYVAAPALAGQGLFLVALCIVRWRNGRRPEAWRLARRGAGSIGLALILYSPWIPAQYYAYQSFYGKGSTNPLSIVEVLRNFRFFLEYFYQGPLNKLFLAIPLALLGFIAFLRSHSSVGVWLILAWGLPPIAAAYIVKTEFSVSPKYVMSGFYLLAFGLGFGTETVARFATRLFPKAGNTVGWITAIGLIGIVGSSNLNFSTFFQGKMYSDRASLRQVALAKNNIDFIFYENERNYSFVGDWYLGDLFKRASDRLERDYKRYYLLSSAHMDVPFAQKRFTSEPFTAFTGSIVNRAPLAVLPDASGTWKYTDAFRDFKLFTDAFATDNVTVNLLEGGLVPSDMSRPGTALYSFSRSEGTRILAARIRLTASCLKRNVFFPDATITVLAGSSPDHLVPVGHLDAQTLPGPPTKDQNYRGLYPVGGNWEIPPALITGQQLYVSLTVSNGTREGSVKAESFTLDISCQGEGPDATAAMRQEWSNILANLSDTKRPYGDSVVTPGRLVAFSCDEDIFLPDQSVGLQAKSARERFLQVHPDIVPIHVIRDGSGNAALELYDPWLREPYVSLAQDAPLHLDLGNAPLGYKARGSLDPTLATLNGQPIPLSLGLPSQATTVFSHKGESFIVAQELFDQANVAPQDFHTLRDIRILPEAAALTCMGKTPCQVTYQFRSLYPLTKLVLTTYPHIYCDTDKNNSVRVSFAENGQPFQEIFTLRSNGSQEWIGTGSYPHVDAVPLAKGTHEVLIKLEMANDGGLWHSSPDAPMTFELFMDSTGMPPIAPGIAELLPSTGNKSTAALSFFSSPASAFENLRPGLTITPFLRPFFR